MERGREILLRRYCYNMGFYLRTKHNHILIDIQNPYLDDLPTSAFQYPTVKPRIDGRGWELAYDVLEDVDGHAAKFDFIVIIIRGPRIGQLTPDEREGLTNAALKQLATFGAKDKVREIWFEHNDTVTTHTVDSILATFTAVRDVWIWDLLPCSQF